MTDLARSFERAAEAYERGRPGYAEAALDAVGLPADAVVLDLAAGTGKLTRQLVPRFARVIAVEPLDGMRAVLERVVPEAEALQGSADSIPLPDRSFDGVFVAEAFHWFATEHAVVEIARVLRPGGVLAVLFNQADGELDPPLPQAFHDAYQALAIRKPPEFTVRSGLWRAPFPGPFEPFTEASFPNPVERDAEGMLAHIASWSMVAGLPEEERTVLQARLAQLIPEGRYLDPLRTDVFRARLRPDTRPSTTSAAADFAVSEGQSLGHVPTSRAPAVNAHVRGTVPGTRLERPSPTAERGVGGLD